MKTRFWWLNAVQLVGFRSQGGPAKVFLAVALLACSGDRLLAQLCFHGGALTQNVISTNCLGQVVIGRAHVGDTVGVLIAPTMVDDCAGDQTLVFSVMDTINYNSTNSFTTTNLLGAPILLTNYLQQSVISNVASGPFQGVTYTYVVPSDALPIVLHTSSELARDTNSATNPNGLLGGTGSAQLQVLRPHLSITKNCLPGVGENGLISFSGVLTNDGNVTLTNVFVFNNQPTNNTMVLGPITLTNGESRAFSGSYHPANICVPTTDTLTAFGTDILVCTVTATATNTCPIITTPAIVVTKTCPTNLLQPGAVLLFSGTVSNAGNITLTNVTVVNNQPSNNTPVFGPITLAPGQSTNFTSSYTLPLDSCGPYSDTLTARGISTCGVSITNIGFASCPGTNSPSITVTKSCPPNPVPPGGIMNISGVVSNTGNVSLTNVFVTNVIAAISQTHVVLGPVTLAPGASLSFTDSYVVPLDSCGPYRDTVIATGADKCFGRVVSASAFRDCPGITTPRIVVTKQCPTNPVAPGGIAVFSGTVSNAGNITLTNVVVVNNRPTNNTPVLGPITLAPGQSTNFTGSEVVPANCCTYFDTLTAVGASSCTGSNVLHTATAVCPTITTPKISVIKNCPPNPVPLGQAMVFSGSVSNSGNITLIDVFVVDNKPTNNTPVLGPITLAPGERVNFSGSYPVPINTCETNLADTVTAQGKDVCTGSNVTANATAVCPIVPTPRLALTKQCPTNPVAPGQLLVYSGTVSNAGTITITNVTVVNDRPVPNTPVLGPVTLIPGQVMSFGGSYLAPYDCCGPCVDTLTAVGQEFCNGSNVVATASAACPRQTTPQLAVTRFCPVDEVTIGDLVFVTGSVSNSGNATLNNVLVVDDKAGIVMDNFALAPGEVLGYLGMFIATNCGPNVTNGVTASASDVCTGIVVSNRFVTSCPVTCLDNPQPDPVILLNARIEGSNFRFSFLSQTNQAYLIEFTDSLSAINWQPLTNVSGSGGFIDIPDTLTNAQRFYRVISQE